MTARDDLFARMRAERDQAIRYLCSEFPDDREYLGRARAEVRGAAIVLGSPRGGTSVFKQVLGSARGALAWPGEHRLLFTLLGLNFPDHGGLDECAETGPLDSGQREFLFDNLLFECRGPEITEPTRREWERYAWDWALRLRLQWPEVVDCPLESLVTIIMDVVPRKLADPDPAFGVLRALRAAGLPLNPYYYDLPDDRVGAYFPDVELPTGPPGRTIVEISPFLALRPTARPRLLPSGNVLVLKASSDAYRIPLLHELFTGWDVRELHLTRNPLASVNGLINGWEHRSFWQHDLRPHGCPRPDWNFDLCEGWAELAAGGLTELAARQWSDPHRRILRHARDPVRLRFEDFQRGGAARHALMDQAAAAAGLSFHGRREAIDWPRAVNSTSAPAPAKWLRERPELRALLALPEVEEVATQLGYHVGDADLWP